MNQVSIPVLQRLKLEAFPFLFFGALLGWKVYALIDFLYVRDGYSQLLYLFQLRDFALGPEITQAIVNGIARISYNVVAILFDALVFAGYLLRSSPVSKARGFWERYFPLVTVLFPMVGFSILLIPGFDVVVPPFQMGEIAASLGLSPLWPVFIEIAAVVIAIAGSVLGSAALWSLKRSFGLMAEVRELVTAGLYRTIRHPLYMAEIIQGFGIAVLTVHPIGLGVYAITVILQVVRARVEERKLLRRVPAYAEYMRSTGFLWPKLKLRTRGR
jgi:protein-S-isoprenylcysteine O-methyltransferase Ste14